MRRMSPRNFLFIHKIQACKCHNYSHYLSKKYPVVTSIVNNVQRDGPNNLALFSVMVSRAIKL